MNSAMSVGLTNHKYDQNVDFEYLSPMNCINENTSIGCVVNSPQSNERSSRRAECNKDKKKQTILTMQWLHENYVITEGVCLPRCILYSHYLNFCQNYCLEPACAATFGKMIRQKFPGITTRRLGTRGHSKYHYYGIGIRETSQYFHAVYSSKGLTRFSTCNSNELKRNDFTPEGIPSALYTFLDQYPDISKITLEPSFGLEKNQIEDLLGRHKNQCENIITAIINKNFLEVQNLVLRFWQSLPQQNHQLLEIGLIVDVICLGESVLYKDLTNILIPVSKEDVSESTLEEIKYVAKHWEDWAASSLANVSQILSNKLIPIAHQFAQSVKRQSSFLHLARSVHKILHEPEKITAMINDISRVDLGSIGSQAFYASAESEGQDAELNSELLRDLKELLRKHVPLEKYITWLDSIVERKVIKPSKQNGRSTKKRAQDFLLKWSFFGARIMHNLTLNNAISSGSFHALRMLFDEYILFGVETQFNNEKDQELVTTVEKHLRKQARASLQYYTSIRPAKRWCPTNPQNCANNSKSPIIPFTRSSVINQASTRYPSIMHPPNIAGFSPQVYSTGRLETYFPTPNYPTTLSSQYDVSRSNPQFNSVFNHDSATLTQYSTCCIEFPQPESATSSYVCEGDQTFTSLENIQSNDMFSYMSPQESTTQSQRERANIDVTAEDYSPATSVSHHQYVPVISSTGNAIGPTTCASSVQSDVIDDLRMVTTNLSTYRDQQQYSQISPKLSTMYCNDINITKPTIAGIGIPECCENFKPIEDENNLFQSSGDNFVISKSVSKDGPEFSQYDFGKSKVSEFGDERIFTNGNSFQLQASTSSDEADPLFRDDVETTQNGFV